MRTEEEERTEKYGERRRRKAASEFQTKYWASRRKELEIRKVWVEEES